MHAWALFCSLIGKKINLYNRGQWSWWWSAMVRAGWVVMNNTYQTMPSPHFWCPPSRQGLFEGQLCHLFVYFYETQTHSFLEDKNGRLRSTSGFGYILWQHEGTTAVGHPFPNEDFASVATTYFKVNLIAANKQYCSTQGHLDMITRQNWMMLNNRQQN